MIGKTLFAVAWLSLAASCVINAIAIGELRRRIDILEMTTPQHVK